MESHLITSIGENCYLALAKGPLIEDHMLILPVEHLPNTLSSPPECEIELVRFQKSLKVYFENQGKQVVFFEWAYVQGTHANLQVKRKLPSVYLLQVCETEVPKLFCSLGF